MHLLTLWPWLLTFQPQSHAMSRIVYLKVIPYTQSEHFGLIRFWVMSQTDKQPDGSEHSTHADRLCQRR